MKRIYLLVLMVLLHSCIVAEKEEQIVDVISWEDVLKNDAFFWKV